MSDWHQCVGMLLLLWLLVLALAVTVGVGMGFLRWTRRSLLMVLRWPFRQAKRLLARGARVLWKWAKSCSQRVAAWVAEQLKRW